jgi:hypothetical protein
MDKDMIESVVAAAMAKAMPALFAKFQEGILKREAPVQFKPVGGISKKGILKNKRAIPLKKPSGINWFALENHETLQKAAEFVLQNRMKETPAERKKELEGKRKIKGRPGQVTRMAETLARGRVPVKSQAYAMRVATKPVGKQSPLDRKRYEMSGIVLAACRQDPSWDYQLDDDEDEDEDEVEVEDEVEDD